MKIENKKKQNKYIVENIVKKRTKKPNKNNYIYLLCFIRDTTNYKT